MAHLLPRRAPATPTLDIFRRIRGARSYIRECGVRGYSQAIYSGLYDSWYERRTGADTKPVAGSPGSGEIHPDQVAYVPISYAALISVFRKAGVGDGTHLVDYGCGAGRVLLVAAQMGVASATGVELQSALAARARANVDRLPEAQRDRLRIVEADATSFTLPDETTTIFFFKPFIGETLQKVVEQIRSSVACQTRPLTVIYFNDQDFRPLAVSAKEVVHWGSIEKAGGV